MKPNHSKQPSTYRGPGTWPTCHTDWLCDLSQCDLQVPQQSTGIIMPAFRGSFKTYLIYSGFFFFSLLAVPCSLQGSYFPNQGFLSSLLKLKRVVLPTGSLGKPMTQSLWSGWLGIQWNGSSAISGLAFPRSQTQKLKKGQSAYEDWSRLVNCLVK